jgi:hypothetical protein
VIFEKFRSIRNLGTRDHLRRRRIPGGSARAKRVS